MSFFGKLFGKKTVSAKQSNTAAAEIVDTKREVRRQRGKDESLRLIADILDKKKTDDSSFDILLESLQHKEYMVRYKAADALHWLANRHGMKNIKAVEPLIVLLKDDFHETRKAAALALGFIGDKSAVAPMIAALEDEYLGKNKSGEVYKMNNVVVTDMNDYVRSCMARGLGLLGDSKALEILNKALNDKADVVREDARNAVARIQAG